MGEAEYVCPVCGETIVIPVDLSQGRVQQYGEDCPVCCCALTIRIEIRANGEICCDAEAD